MIQFTAKSNICVQEPNVAYLRFMNMVKFINLTTRFFIMLITKACLFNMAKMMNKGMARIESLNAVLKLLTVHPLGIDQ